MAVKERLTQYLSLKKISKSEFGRAIGVSSAYISSIRKSIQPEKIRAIALNYPDLNTEWLLTGEGEMLRTSAGNKEAADGDPRGFTEGKLIPLFDADAAAGSNYGVNMTPARQIEMIQIGGFLRESEAALRVYGNSMIPHYPPGCIVGTKPWNERFIEPGQVYVIETEENRFLKRLLYNEGKTAYRCLSDNTMRYDSGAAAGELCYPEFEIPIEDVRRIFRVVGVVKRNII